MRSEYVNSVDHGFMIMDQVEPHHRHSLRIHVAIENFFATFLVTNVSIELLVQNCMGMCKVNLEPYGPGTCL